MRRFVRHLLADGDLDVDPMATMSPPEAPAPHVPVLSDDELTALVKACAGTDFRDRRDEVVIRLLVDCGLRASELCSLKVDDLDLDNRTAIVVGKGRKPRAVYWSARTARALDRYLKVRRRHRRADDTGVLLLTQRGPMSPDGLRELLKVRARAPARPGCRAAELPSCRAAELPSCRARCTRTRFVTRSPMTSSPQAVKRGISCVWRAGPPTRC